MKLLSKNNSEIVNYLGVVSDLELAEAIGRTDVLLNPHIIMDGVFPFKLIEYVSSGRLILSSEMTFPLKLSWIKESIIFENLDLDKWIDIILSSSIIYNSKKDIINSFRRSLKNFQNHQLRMKLRNLLIN